MSLKIHTSKGAGRFRRWKATALFGLMSFLLSGGSLMAQAAEESPKLVLVSQSFWNSLIIEYIMVGAIFLLIFLIFLMLTVNPDKLNFNVALGDITGSTAEDPQMDHEYDGIIELDNPVPAWLRMILYGSVVFGVVYIAHYHVLGTGQTQEEEYESEIALAETMYKNVELPEDAIKLVSDEGQLKIAEALFQENCAACHGVLGEGKDGPNLTDEYWLHGGGVKNIYQTITNGVPAKGMISWKKLITSKERLALASYIEGMYGTNPPNGREAQGEKWSEEGEESAPATEETPSEEVGETNIEELDKSESEEESNLSE